MNTFPLTPRRHHVRSVEYVITTYLEKRDFPPKFRQRLILNTSRVIINTKSSYGVTGLRLGRWEYTVRVLIGRI